MTVSKQSRANTDRKTSMFKVFDQEFDACSSSEDMDSYSPKSVVSKARKSRSPVKDVDIFGRLSVRNQIERIRAEDSHLGEDIGECLIARICNDQIEDVIIFSRPASPLSGRKHLSSPRINTIIH